MIAQAIGQEFEKGYTARHTGGEMNYYHEKLLNFKIKVLLVYSVAIHWLFQSKNSFFTCPQFG
jgi:hypothetical protein